MRNDGERLATLQEVAEYLNVPVGTLYAWRYKGEGPTGYRIGRYVPYRWTDVDKWLETQRDQPRTQRQPPPPQWLPLVPGDYRPLRRIKERPSDGASSMRSLRRSVHEVAGGEPHSALRSHWFVLVLDRLEFAVS